MLFSGSPISQNYQSTPMWLITYTPDFPIPVSPFLFRGVTLESHNNIAHTWLVVGGCLPFFGTTSLHILLLHACQAKSHFVANWTATHGGRANPTPIAIWQLTQLLVQLLVSAGANMHRYCCLWFVFDNLQSTNSLNTCLATQPTIGKQSKRSTKDGIQLATIRSQVRRPNRYAKSSRSPKVLFNVQNNPSSTTK